MVFNVGCLGFHMFLVDDIKGGGVATILVGAAAILLAPVVAPVLAQAARPLLKEIMKGGLMCYQKGREAMAEVGEVFDDVLAEAKAELDASRAAPAAAGEAEAGSGEPPAEVVG